MNAQIIETAVKSFKADAVAAVKAGKALNIKTIVNFFAQFENVGIENNCFKEVKLSFGALTLEYNSAIKGSSFELTKKLANINTSAFVQFLTA